MGNLNKYKKRSKKREAATAKELGGKVVPGSGCIQDEFMKEDVHSKHFILQHKALDQLGFRITTKDFRLCEDRALRQCKMPAYRVEFCQEGLDIAIIRWQDLIQLLIDAGYDK